MNQKIFSKRNILSTLIILMSVLCLGFGMSILAPNATNRSASPTIDGKVHATVTEDDFGTNCHWTFDDSNGTLTISSADGTNNATMPDYTTNTYRSAPWYSYKSLITSVVITNKVTNVPNFTFYGYDEIANVTFGEDVISIGEYAFAQCTSLTSITIPDNVTSIGEDAFSGCENLATVVLPSNLGYIVAELFWYCGSLTDIVIPSTVEYIGGSAFEGCNSLDSVVFEDNSQLTEIGYYAFGGCTALESVDFGENSVLETIGIDAFISCESLTEITIPASVTYIGSRAFMSCSELKTVIFEGGETEQGDTDAHSLFYDYTEREYYFENESDYQIVVPIEYIDTYKAMECWEDYVDLFTGPYLVTNGIKYSIVSTTEAYVIGYTDDLNYPNVTILGSVTISANTYSVTRIDEYAFNECDAIVNLVIPSTVVYIDCNAFEGCTSLETVTIADNSQLMEIGVSAFGSCSALESIDFGENSVLESIYDCAFYYCESLAEITIPASVTYIGPNAFMNCPALKTVTFEGGNVDKDDGDYTFFYDGNDDCFYFESVREYFIYVPDEYYNYYTLINENWADYAEARVIRRMSLLTAYKVTYTIADGTIEGEPSVDDDGNVIYGDMPHINMIVRDPNLWEQYYGPEASSVDGATNAIYTEIDMIPNDTIDYNIKVNAAFRVYIYFYRLKPLSEIGEPAENETLEQTVSRNYTMSSTYDLMYQFDNYGQIVGPVYFDMDVYRIRFILVRYSNTSYNKPSKLIPTQITTSRFNQLRLSPCNYNVDGEFVPTDNTSYVGYYKPGYTYMLPKIATSPDNMGYTFVNWLTDSADESSNVSAILAQDVITGGSTTLYAEWTSPTMYLWFNVNFNANEQYVKIDGISATSYGEEISFDDIFTAIAATTGLYYEKQGYIISAIECKSGERGTFWRDSDYDNQWTTSLSWVEVVEHWDDLYFHFTSGDGYFYVKSWLPTDKAYLYKGWKNVFNEAMDYSWNATNRILSMIFTNVEPEADPDYDVINIGAYSNGSKFYPQANVKMYIYDDNNVTYNNTDDETDETEYHGYNIVIYSPNTIYAPVDSSELFFMSAIYESWSTANITSFDFSNFDFSQTKYMERMFCYCASVEDFSFVENMDISNVIKTNNMFESCLGMESINLSNWDVGNVYDMTRMFADCTNLVEINFGKDSFDTTQVGRIDEMFSGCSSLASLDLSFWDFSYIEWAADVFNGCESLNVIYLPLNLNSVTRNIVLPEDSNGDNNFIAEQDSTQGSMLRNFENVLSTIAKPSAIYREGTTRPSDVPSAGAGLNATLIVCGVVIGLSAIGVGTTFIFFRKKKVIRK